MGSVAPTPEVFDMVIIGAGVSGINAAYRIQTDLPKYRYTILEARDAIGGTWDLFRYPGIRSDSDLHTFGFPWRQWDSARSIASGADIKSYIERCAAEFDIDKKIQFKHSVESTDWSSDEQQWTITAKNNGRQKFYKARFVFFCSGYYDYHTPLKAEIPGIKNFEGTTIHPQFWPEDLKMTGKKMVIIGSGATAVTLLPNVVEDVEKVTMLQRSPSYVIAQPAVDPIGKVMNAILPKSVAHSITRWKFITLPLMFFHFCRSFPTTARKLLRRATIRYLPKNVPHDPHFNPRYNPWEQRLCVCPDGDFYKALQSGKADIVTDTIQEVQKDGILTKSGKFLPADIIVTATGLKVLLAGGARITVDGRLFEPGDSILWRGVMLADLPNAAFVVGYTNASWTLGADVSARHVVRMLKFMESKGYTVATPHADAELLQGPNAMKLTSSLNLNSTYIEKAKGILPSAGDRAPWLPRTNFITDKWNALRTSLTDGVVFQTAADKKTK